MEGRRGSAKRALIGRMFCTSNPVQTQLLVIRSVIIMEAEERPTKLQKIKHTQDEDTIGPQSEISGTLQASSADALSIPGAKSNTTQNVQEVPSHAALPQVNQDMSPDRNCDQSPPPGSPLPGATATEEALPKPLSKNQQKKLKRQQEWEAGREERKVQRREKAKAKRERKRAVPNGEDEDTAEITKTNPDTSGRDRYEKAVQLPVTFLFDCDFDNLMLEKEIKSLGSQLTRCYSDNKNAHLRAHLAVASFSGSLRERFDGLLAKHYESWKGVRFFSEDFVEVAEKASVWMREKDGGQLAGALLKQEKADTDMVDGQQDEASVREDGQESIQNIKSKVPDGLSDQSHATPSQEGEIIYLTSDSPDTLTTLKPNSTYIIGGIVDRNRHKGICFKRAKERGIKTAKLPIGEFMEMNSRFVLATNHVNEIMLKWLENGDWGESFEKVMPKRKGGRLKDRNKNEDVGVFEAEAEEEAEEPDDAQDGEGEVVESSSLS